MLGAEGCRNIIAQATVNSPCSAPDGSRISRTTAPAAPMCQTAGTNCVIASESQIHTECLYVIWKLAIVAFYINKQKSNEMHLDCLLYHLIPPTCFGRHRPSSGWCYKISSKII
jgi:hypothetical protein